MARHFIVEAVSESLDDTKHRILLDDQVPHRKKFTSTDPKGYGYEVQVAVRMIGQDTGKDVLFNFGQQIRQLNKAILAASRPPTSDELRRLKDFMEKDPA